jgi:hypothetical protein
VVDGLELVRERIYAGDTDGELGIAGVGQADTGGLGGQAKAGGITCEGGTISLDFYLQVSQVLTFE